MFPKSSVIIYYLNSGEIISDKVEVEFENELLNHVEVKLSANQLKPGENLDITVKSKQNSFVGLLGVDQSVLVLRKGNDLTKSEIFNEIKKYGISKKKLKSTKNYKDFTNSKIIIITNAKKEFEGKPKLPFEILFPSFGFGHGGYRGFNGFATYGSAANAAPQYMFSQSFNAQPSFNPQPSFNGGSPLTSGGIFESSYYTTKQPVTTENSIPKPKKKEPIEIRNVFPETWIFDSFELKSK
jgi:Alpha-2-macroglobulin bait region domain